MLLDVPARPPACTGGISAPIVVHEHGGVRPLRAIATDRRTTRCATAWATDGGVADEGKYIILWRRVGGAWYVHRDIWNSNRQPIPAPKWPTGERLP